MSSRPQSEGLRITKVGVWFVVFAFIVLLAATNTGNNGLYLVLALMGGAFVVAHMAGARNVRGLTIDFATPPEIYAKRPLSLEPMVRNGSRWWPRWLLVLRFTWRDFEQEVDRSAVKVSPCLAAFLPPRGVEEPRLELMIRRRGRHRIRHLRVSSLFPLGLFHKSMRYPVDLELLVFPEVFSPTARRPSQLGKSGDEPSRKVGWGHDLLSMRPYRSGDDPRSIHWKQSARTGGLILKERESEENRRLLILFDNGVGSLDDRLRRRRFERLVSEAATAALDYLGQGFEVSLLTRDTHLGFATGAGHRYAMLEALALVQPTEKSRKPLTSGSIQAPELRLTMDAEIELRDPSTPSVVAREVGAA